MNLKAALLNLLEVGAAEVAMLEKGTTAGTVATLSDDLLNALRAVLATHAANQGKTIDEVIAEL